LGKFESGKRDFRVTCLRWIKIQDLKELDRIEQLTKQREAEILALFEPLSNVGCGKLIGLFPVWACWRIRVGLMKAFPVSLNTTYPATLAAVAVVYMAITDPHMPFNQGLLRPLKLIVPENTIFNAKRPAAVSVYWETMTYAADLVWKALAPRIQDKLSAGHFLSVCAEIIAGIDPRNKEYFVLVEPNPGGWGAAADKDGESQLG